jgi:outer membrane receptor protein involved in Fe transport
MKLSNKFIYTLSAVALMSGGVAIAQEDDGERKLESVTVTGSFIQGTPEDAALPVDVLTANDLKLEGNPSITELIKNLGVSSGTDGNTNQFASNGLEGTSNVNLRGLGPGRTLVLINGRRQTFSPYGVGEQAQLFVDTNMIPSAAIGRIEVLKDGAAALYGSDAIAGVVNFITRDDLEGFEVGGDIKFSEGTDGDYTVNGAYGWQGTNSSWVTSIGYQAQNEIPLLERDFAIQTLAENPVGGFSSLSNPGRFLILNPGVVGQEIDVGCGPLGGQFAGDGTCRFQFTQFDNLQEEQERYQIFSEFNHDFGGVKLHLEGLYGHTDTPSWKTSPSYPPQVLTSQFVPANSPGYVQYIADNPTSTLATTPGIGALFIGRTFGYGGFPGTGGAQEGFRTYDGYRLAGDLEGDFANGMNWNVGLSYSTTEGERETNDTYIAGLTAALRGFGVCTDAATGNDPATGTQPYAAGYTGALTAGAGACEYYNPFSNAIPASAITGDANPGFVPGLENSLALADWITDGVGTTVTTDLLVFDAVVSGETSFQLAGGNVGFAVGAQARREGYEVEPNDVTDLATSPGPDGNGPFSFLAGTNSADLEQEIYAVFAEAQLPVSDKLNVQLAARFEDYGGETGNTFDPKVAAKYQLNDSFALRGSFQTSFKGPTLNQLSGRTTSLQFVAPTSAFKAVDQNGDPNLKPESATSFNLGALYDDGNGLSASVDYYDFDFEDPIIVEGQGAIVTAAVAAIGAGDFTNPILNRITFNDPTAVPAANQIARIETNITNGPDIKTSGVDIRAAKLFSGFGQGPGDLEFAVDGTYIFEYDVDDFEIEGVAIPGGDRVGQFNRSNFSRSLPRWKANLSANYALGSHNARAVVRHISDYKDERGVIAKNTATIDSQTTLDLFYNYSFDDWGLDIGAGIVNVFDEDPPFAAFDLNYDPYTHNPFGRTFKLSATKAFGLGN